MKLFDYCVNQRTIKESIRVRAIGIPNIRRLYPDKASMIRRAYEQALAYVRETLSNMERIFSDARLDQKRRHFAQRFFDTPSLSHDTITKIKLHANILLGALLDPSLNPQTSSRYVVGAAIHPEHSIQAFTVLNEPSRRIYFTERFFDPGFDIYLPLSPRTFDMLGHNMAAVLLHEVSHLALDTLDLAYLDSSRPFLDLLNIDTAAGRDRHASLERLQRDSLSVTTPANELFKELDDYDLHWHDLVGTPLQRILQLTGTRNLDDARRVFFADENKRIDVILSNADSLALLIAHLGRPVEYQPLLAASKRH